MPKLPPVILEIDILLLHRVRKKYLCDRRQLWPQLSQLFLNRFSKFLCLSCSKFPEFFKTPPTFAFWMNFVWENGKKQNEVWLLGHPVSLPFRHAAKSVSPSSSQMSCCLNSLQRPSFTSLAVSTSLKICSTRSRPSSGRAASYSASVVGSRDTG